MSSEGFGSERLPKQVQSLGGRRARFRDPFLDAADCWPSLGGWIAQFFGNLAAFNGLVEETQGKVAG